MGTSNNPHPFFKDADYHLCPSSTFQQNMYLDVNGYTTRIPIYWFSENQNYSPQKKKSVWGGRILSAAGIKNEKQ